MAVLARTEQAEASAIAGAKTPEMFATAIILENYDADDFRKILAVNRFEDVTWFNKEAFEETLSLASLFALSEACRTGKTGNPEKWRKNVDTIAAVVEAFSKAEKASRYRFDELTAVLSGEKPQQDKSGTDKTGKKNPATGKSVTDKSVAKKPVTEKSGTEKPVTDKSVAKKSGTEKSTKQKSGSTGKKEPGTDKSVAEKPTKQKSGSPGTPRAKGKK
jgi:hypothetical protein